MFAAHIFTVSTFSQLWIQIGKLWTARQGPAVSLKIESFEFLLPQPPSAPNTSSKLSATVWSLNIWNTLGFLQLIQWWNVNGCRRERDHWRKNTQMLFRASSRAAFLQAPSNLRDMLEKIWEMEEGDRIIFNLNIIKILSRKLQHKMSYTQQGRVETRGTPMVLLRKCCKSFAAIEEIKTH